MTLPKLRRTEQPLLPKQRPAAPEGYDLYPAHTLKPGVIETGFDALAAHLSGCSNVVIDGYVGVLWTDFAQRLEAALVRQGQKARFFDVREAMHAEAEIGAMLEPFLGGDDPVFGTRTTLALADLFDAARLPEPADTLSIVYGCGAALCGWPGALQVYVELPKNELQFRSRAGTVTNLGLSTPLPPKEAYKRFYFADWILLNEHKKRLLPRIDLLVDAQRVEEPALMTGDTLRGALRELSGSTFRARPWFEPGAWGGQWLKHQIDGLAQDVPNYAWSFELIVPENGLLFESDGRSLEVSFDMLMFQESTAVLGDHQARFGCDFPIRFDYLDTVGGGNLSVQCHPRPEYMQAHFGEPFTQDETYYIVHCEDDAKVYLGFNEQVDKDAFVEAVTRSQKAGTPVDIERFVNVAKAEQHRLYLIPSGTVHSSGAGNLVLEISATPYIFTFKIYDWLRLDLDGKPRALNIERAAANLDFSRRGRVAEDLVVKPVVLSETEAGRTVHLPTHAEHFYDVHRLEVSGRMVLETRGSPHVLCVVEGTNVEVGLPGRPDVRYSFAETFVVPAAVERYTLAASGNPVKVVQAFLKPGA